MNQKIITMLAICAASLSSCSDDNEPGLTQQIDQVETHYSQGMKKETRASEAYMRELESEINKLMGERTSGRIAAVGDYDIGFVVKNDGTCLGEKIAFYLDCENDTRGTHTESRDGGVPPWKVYSPADGEKWGDVLMTFCRIDGQGLSGTYAEAFAVLKVGALSLPGSTTIKRRFDSEDDNNKNYTVGNIGINYHIGNNMALYFSAFEGGGSQVVPRMVLGGRRGVARVKYEIDDENSDNQNYWSINGGPEQEGFSNNYMAGSDYTTIWVRM